LCFHRSPYLHHPFNFANRQVFKHGLAFATAQARSDSPAVAYASVYPLTMLLRIIVAQVLVLL
jgi:uncharacterized transporter YbjL